jgi:hypothetical protein
MDWGRAILGVFAILASVVAILVGSFTSVIADESEQWHDDNCGPWRLGSAEDCSEMFDASMWYRIVTNASWGCGIVSVLVGLALLATSGTKGEKTVYIQQPPSEINPDQIQVIRVHEKED